MSVDEIITRLENRVMDAAEYISYCKNLIMQLKEIDPVFNVVGIWSDLQKCDYYFNQDLSDFGDIVFAEMQEESKEYTFINMNTDDKILHLDSKNDINFGFTCGFGENEESDISIYISYGSIDKSEFGIINFEFSDDYQQTMPESVLNGVVNLFVNNEKTLNVAVLSSELEDEIIEREEDDDYMIGWITYLRNKNVTAYLPPEITKENKENGVLFSFNPTSTIPEVMKVTQSLCKEGFLKYK